MLKVSTLVSALAPNDIICDTPQKRRVVAVIDRPENLRDLWLECLPQQNMTTVTWLGSAPIIIERDATIMDTDVAGVKPGDFLKVDQAFTKVVRVINEFDDGMFFLLSNKTWWACAHDQKVQVLR